MRGTLDLGSLVGPDTPLQIHSGLPPDLPRHHPRETASDCCAPMTPKRQSGKRHSLLSVHFSDARVTSLGSGHLVNQHYVLRSLTHSVLECQCQSALIAGF